MAIPIGIAAAVVYFHMANRWAYVEATGSPKFNMAEWWMVCESAIAGILATLLVIGVGAGIYRIHHGRSVLRRPIDSDHRDDPFGLDPGVTPTSIGGAMLQALARFFRKQ